MQLKLEKLNLDRKKIIIGIIAVVVLIVSIIIIKHAFSTGTETTLFDKTVQEITFSEGNINTINGISTLNLKATNDSGQEYTLKNITIEIQTETETINLVGYVGESIEKGETKNITASIDKEIENITKVTYTINK